MIVCLIDAGPLVALFDDDDQHHARYSSFVSDRSQPVRLHTTWPCVVEAVHLLAPALGRTLLGWVARGGAHVFPFNPDALTDMVEWMDRYTAMPRTRMDFADASLYWLATQTGVSRIATIDHRDFLRYRLPDGRAFEVV